MRVKLVVTRDAVDCFKKEWGYAPGDQVRVYVRYISGSKNPFGFGLMKDTPNEPAAMTVVEGYTFYMEADDVKFIHGDSLTIDAEKGEIVYRVDAV